MFMFGFFFFSSRRRHTRSDRDWSSDVCSSDLIFAGSSGTFLALNKGSIVRRRFRPGEIICREGEHGSTAFYVLSGQVEVSISTPMAHVKSGRRTGRVEIGRASCRERG